MIGKSPKALLNRTRSRNRLFEIEPQVKDLFPFGNDMTHPSLTTHALNVMNAVDLAVQNLDNPDVLISALQELGRAHAMFELTNQDFGVRFTSVTLCLLSPWMKP